MRLARALGALLVLSGLLAGPAAARPAPAARQDAPAIELLSQTPLATPGGAVVLGVRLVGIPEDGRLVLKPHQRVRSRSELDLSIRGEALRSTLVSAVTPLAAIPPDAEGTRQVTLSLDPAAGGVRLPAAGVYPLELIAQDGAGRPLTTLITHLIAPPEAGDASPPLNVAVVAQVGASPAVQSDGTARLDREEVADVAGLVGALRAAGDVPASLAVTPETLDALTSSTVEGDPEVVDELRAAAAARGVLAAPYVHVSPDALVQSGLTSELGVQRQRGRQVLDDALGRAPSGSTWLADPDLGADGLTALASLGVQHVVVRPDQVAPIPDGVLSLSLAHRFPLAPPAEDAPVTAPANVDAIAVDPVVLQRLTADEPAGLVANRVLTELAVLWFEQPGMPRGAVLPVDPGTDPAVVQALLEGLAAGGTFRAVTLDELFAATGPLLDAGGNPISRALTPADSATIGAAEAAAVRAARESLASYDSLLGGDSPRADPLERELLLATAADLSRDERRAHREAVVRQVDAVAAGVSGPERFTLTLTAREGTVPLTLRNDTGLPLHVTVHLQSAKLDFPEGRSIPLVLTEPSTRIDIPVEARASGAFPLDIEVTSPDGGRSLVTSSYTVRSTAVAGVGLVLSVGAGLFLVVWWARHWRQTRRSARLVAAPEHPSAQPGQ